MRLTDAQRRFIKKWIENIDLILAHEPQKGGIGLRLEKRWLGMILKIDSVEDPKNG